ncbi:aminotransferase class IV [Peribacillus frigoritolerans]|nr:aminotransferase class IV [Peribacillus frigoritolerans]
MERPAYKLLESIKLSDGEYYLLNDHIDRMKQSAEYFDYRFSELYLRDRLQKYAEINHGTLQKSKGTTT